MRLGLCFAIYNYSSCTQGSVRIVTKRNSQHFSLHRAWQTRSYFKNCILKKPKYNSTLSLGYCCLIALWHCPGTSCFFSLSPIFWSVDWRAVVTKPRNLLASLYNVSVDRVGLQWLFCIVTLSHDNNSDDDHYAQWPSGWGWSPIKSPQSDSSLQCGARNTREFAAPHFLPTEVGMTRLSSPGAIVLMFLLVSVAIGSETSCNICKCVKCYINCFKMQRIKNWKRIE